MKKTSCYLWENRREGEKIRDGRAERLLLQEISVDAAAVAVSSEIFFFFSPRRKQEEGRRLFLVVKMRCCRASALIVGSYFLMIDFYEVDTCWQCQELGQWTCNR